MLYQSPSQTRNSAPTEWLPAAHARRSAYRIFVTCLTTSAQRVQLLVTRSLQSKGASVRVRAEPPVDTQDQVSRVRMVFSVDGANLRGAIATLINLLGADTCVRTVRWESNPKGV